jgi:lipopolysaccharide export system protein LptA
MKTRILLLSMPLWCGFWCCSSEAQNAAIKTGTGNDTLTITAPKMTGRLGSKQGALLEGTAAKPAKISHPQLDVSAPRINVASDENYPIKNVAATGGVQFKVSLAQKNAPPVRIEAKCDNATLDRGEKTRVLTLNGGVDGWFQSGDGPRNQLRGQTVKITSQPDAATALIADIKGDAQGVRVDVPTPGKAAPGAKPITITAQNAQLRQTQNGLDADVDGGTLGVRLEIPAMAKNAALGALNNGLNLGAVVVTSQRASVRQADGQARFTGNARAASSGEGTMKFDVSADELSISRATNGEIAAIKTTGRARMKLDLPPDNKDETKPDTKPAESTNKIMFGRPNYLEVEANAATADLTKNVLIFEGDVKGFYRLTATQGQTTTQAAPPIDYKFSSEQAVISYAPEAGSLARGLNIELTGKEQQPQIELPGFKIDEF